jgi:hypothetical protein
MRADREKQAGCRDETECPDGFLADHQHAGRPKCKESVAMDRRPTLGVADILGAGSKERFWDDMPGAGCLRPAPVIGDLGMAGLHIGAPARLQRGGRSVQSGGSSTPLVRDPGELLSHTFSGSSARVTIGGGLR